jgi:glycosyltransferase involved in cell wall biosynthesis
MGPRPTPAQRAQLCNSGKIELVHGDYKLEWMDEPWADVDLSGEWLLELCERTKPDLVHLNGVCHASLPFRVPVCVVMHSCVLSWWFAVFGESAPERYDEYRKRVRAGLLAANRVVAPSRALLAQLAVHYPPFQGGLAIANGIELGELGARAACEFRHKRPVILGAGRIWDAAKNLASLVEVAPELAWPVRMAGEGTLAVPRAPNVEYLGRLEVTQMHAEFADASIFAHPARYEPFGLAPLEAALHGAALVLGDIPSLREVWGDTAVFVAPNDRAALQRALSTLIEREALRANLAERARERALTYTAERMAANYGALYSAMLSEVRESPPRARRRALPATRVPEQTR